MESLQLLITHSSKHDLNVFKQAWSDIDNRDFYGDKIYFDEPFSENLKTIKNSKMYAPAKAKQNHNEWKKQFVKVSND